MGALDAAFAQNMARALEALYSNVQFVPSGSFRDSLKMRRGDILHLHFLEAIPRQPRLSQAILRYLKLSVLLVVLKSRGVGIVWTCHNVSEKGHRRRRLEQALRSTVVCLSNSVTFFNDGAADIVSTQLPRWIGRRLRARSRLVPIPLAGLEHGAPLSKPSARERMGITTDLPVLFCPPGMNRADNPARNDLGDSSFKLLSFDRSPGPKLLEEDTHGWVRHGPLSDDEYGLLLSACDAVLLTDPRALASATLATAVKFRRPLISPPCPAVGELHGLGGAFLIHGHLSGATIAAAVDDCRAASTQQLSAAVSTYEEAHSDERVARALAEAYNMGRSSFSEVARGDQVGIRTQRTVRVR